MNMTALLDYVMPDVPKCPEGIAMNKIRLAAREFFARSALWRHDPFLGINVVQGQRVYPLVPTTPAHETDIVGIMQAWYRGTKIYKRSYHELVSTYANAPTATGQPIYYWFDVDSQITIFPTPSLSVAGALSVLGIQAPKIGSIYFPDQYFDDWAETVASGAKSRLMEVPKKPYYDPQLAVFHQGKFDSGVADARSIVMSGGAYSAEDEITTVFER